MTSLLHWRSPASADRGAFQEFTCTTPGKRRRRLMGGWFIDHPKPWELSVQSDIHRIKPPMGYPTELLVGSDSHGMAAVIALQYVDGAGQVEISHMAVACRLRGKGGGYADEMVAQALDAVTNRAFADGVSIVRVYGYVDPENHPSQRVFRDVGFHHTGDRDAGLQHWSRELLITDPD